ncbi:hypothetical protein EJ110_NYTH07305 [Nymphaea thermarum]|nr:hypothetical protein EJ110_NYTH07305 [Nymphaea thermarum]
MGRFLAANYGGGHNPATFGLTKFMGIEAKVCWDVAGVGEVEFPSIETGFLEDGEASADHLILDLDDDDEEEESVASGEEKAAFWKKQQLLLEAALRRSSSFEKRVKRDTTKALEDAQQSPRCMCKIPSAGGCRNCLQQDVVDRLRKAGHNAAVCRSKWRSSPDIPAGEHSYIDVIDNAERNDDGAAARVVIELDFRAEFEMARGSSEYNQLVNRLPEVFVGKPDRLKEVIKTACTAGKRCMKEKKMHLGPWRRQKYMHAKWLGAHERIEPAGPFSTHLLEKQSKKKMSMLTFDLSRNLPNFAVVEVV